ncbi:MAG: hypothetical protein L0229_29265 [Blastocatellia bacterium]|nr:hypothetical protein [Blastocatellia bacterium]
MSKPSSVRIEQCTQAQLKELLSLAAGQPGRNVSMPIGMADREELYRLLAELCGGEEGSGELLLTTICAEEAPVEALRGIKELAKKLSADARTEAHRNAAILVYHAAIAAAFGRHGINLSSRPIDARCSLYEDLATAFAEDPLGDVFREAADRAMNLEGIP